ncbi:MAG: hypothetical protein DMG72_10175 [Acidobacteria bacterium]|nr:MAG: hypothetical protein DMG72_10175 [Acidobacteriota bacterium]
MLRHSVESDSRRFFTCGTSQGKKFGYTRQCVFHICAQETQKNSFSVALRSFLFFGFQFPFRYSDGVTFRRNSLIKGFGCLAQRAVTP